MRDKPRAVVSDERYRDGGQRSLRNSRIGRPNQTEVNTPVRIVPDASLDIVNFTLALRKRSLDDSLRRGRTDDGAVAKA